MHVGIDARLVGYRRGGIAAYVCRLVEALAKVPEGEEFTVFCGRKPGMSVHGFRRRTLWTPPHHPLEQWALPVELALERLDVLHSPDFIPPFRRRCPAVITIHDLAFMRYPETKDAAGLGYYGQVARALRDAEGIIAVTEATRKDLEDLLGVPPGRVRVVRHGVDPVFQPLGDRSKVKAFCKARGLPETFILWVGTIEPRKNLGVLLQAVRRLPEGIGTLVVAGEPGWRHEETLALLRGLEREGRAIYYGPAGEGDLLMLYNAAWAFAFPSLYEGFGFPPLEAMACGTPVVASTTPALQEVLGDAALFVPPADVEGLQEALVWLAEDGKERSRLRDAGLARAGEFSWDRAAAATLEVYREVARR